MPMTLIGTLLGAFAWGVLVGLWVKKNNHL